jgi:hypothetical protein
MQRVLVSLLSVTVLAGCAGEANETSTARPTSTVRFQGADATLFVEIADDSEERGRGLMGVENLPTDQGMAFVFSGPVEDTFWMKDTLIPLSIAFVDASGRVVDVLDMEPCEADPCPHYGIDEPYVLAIEANSGWFDDHGVVAGDRAELQATLDG